MHEFALATEIVDAASAAAGRHGRIEAVHIAVGSFGHLDADSLSNAFAMASVGTRADGAKLVFDCAAVTCERCGETLRPGEWPAMCSCGAVLLEGGMPELAVTAVDVSG